MPDMFKIQYKGRENGVLEVRRDGLMTVLRADAPMLGGVVRLFVRSGGKRVPIGVMAPAGGRLRLEKRLSRNALMQLGISAIEGAELDDGSGGTAETTINTDAGKSQKNETGREAPKPVNTAPAPPSYAARKTEPPAVSPHMVETHTSEPQAVPPRLEDSGRWQNCFEPWRFFGDAELSQACRGAQGVLMLRMGQAVALAFPFTEDRPFGLMPPFCIGEPIRLGRACYLVFRTLNGELVTG